MKEKNYYGFDVDFEYLDSQNRDLYTGFVRRIGEALNENGFVLITALAPKSRGDQPGNFYESHDYGGIGAVSNYVLLMTYEWGYTYGPPLAVAPIPSVRQVLDYAVTEIPREKIFMGIPTYGYNFRLPYQRGVSRADSVSNGQAVALARRYGAEIQYDEVAQAPFFVYTDEGVGRHEVWFEDARSILAKLDLIREYGFRGAGYWNLDRPFPQNWSLLNSEFLVRY